LCSIILAIILFTLIILDYLERYIFPPERVKVIHLYFHGAGIDTKKIKKALSAYKIGIQSIDVVQSIQKEKVQVNVLARTPVSLNINEFYKELQNLPDIYKIKMEESQ
jgi:uncharacterized membrane protein YhiD involved in acid resistance